MKDYKANILAVDDTADNLRVLSQMLAGEGYKVFKALNGKMALMACQSNPPDLILLDVMMPEMDGYEVCRRLKEDEKTREIPVIFLSALSDVDAKVKAFETGGVDYISKPFQDAEVFSRVETHLKLSRLQASLQEQNSLLQEEIKERQKAKETLEISKEKLEKALRELQGAQVQLVQNEKMAALGQLVAGVAHEINNPVSFIYSNLSSASEYIEDLFSLIEIYRQEYPQPTAMVRETIDEIELDFLVEDLPDILESMHRGADRIKAIVSSLKNFSRLDETELKTVDIHSGIDSTLAILQHRLEKIELIKNYGDLPPVNCYARQLNQVFLHLLNNAIDALSGVYQSIPEKMSEDFAPTIRITTEKAGENTVSIRIANNGSDISESVRSRLFDPFFTTKQVGKGTGLSLSICYQIIVRQHGGNIACCSQPEGGTEFAIAIPVRQADNR